MRKSAQISTLDTIKTLRQEGCFLFLSRTQPELFSHPFEFSLPDETQVHILAEGMIYFEPKSLSDKDIVLSCGIHGNETAPIEICDNLVKQILLGHIEIKQRVLFLFGNLPAMDIAQRFVEENMNRLFCRDKEQRESSLKFSQEKNRAKQLENAVRDFYLGVGENSRERLHYDLHTAIRASKNEKFAVYPYRQNVPWDKEQLKILLACGVNTILLSGSPTTTFSYFSSSEFNANSFTVELGKVKPFGENDMADFTQVITTMTNLICGKTMDLKMYSNDDFLIYKVNQVINKGMDDFSLNFAENEPNFTDYPKNYLLASETGMEYKTQFDGEAIVFPNANVEIGQRALLTVIPTTI